MLILKIALVAVYIAALAVLAWFDYKRHVIPNKIVVPGMVLALLGGVLVFYGWAGTLAGGGIGVAVAAASWYLARAAKTGKGMGGGDLKMLVMTGFMLGLQNIWLALLGAVFVMAGVSMFLLASRMKKRANKLVLGPFLFAAAIAVLVLSFVPAAALP